MQDWMLDADERRYRTFGNFTSVGEPSRKSVVFLGRVLPVLAIAFLIGGLTQL